MIILIACSEENIKHPDDYPTDFYVVQGRVYNVHSYFDWRYLENSRDIYFEYHFDKEVPLKGKWTQTTMRGAREGDWIGVVVNRQDSSDCYFLRTGIVGSGMIPYDEFLKK